LIPAIIPRCASNAGTGSVEGGLAQRLVVHDHAADPALGAGGREQQLAKAPARLRGRLRANRGEPLGHRGVALIGREDALTRRDQLACCRLKRLPVLGHRRASTIRLTKPAAMTIDSV
jgi:hypothetical protein